MMTRSSQRGTVGPRPSRIARPLFGLLLDETKKENREYLGPKLARRLTGNAWDNVESIERDKLKQEDGVSYLLGFLEKQMTGTQGQNMGSRIMGYFVHHHRKPGQSPQDYMTVDTRV